MYQRLISLWFSNFDLLFPGDWLGLRSRTFGRHRGPLVRHVGVGHLRLRGPACGHRSRGGGALEVPQASLCPRNPAVCSYFPQHSGCAQAGQRQQRQQRLRPQRCRLPSAGFWQHDLPPLRARQLWLRAPGLHSSRNSTAEPHQRLLQSLMFADQTSEGLRLQVERKNSVTVRCFHCLFGVYLKPRALLRITPRAQGGSNHPTNVCGHFSSL